MIKLKRRHIFPRRILTVKAGHELQLDAHLTLSNKSITLIEDLEITIITKPRKIGNINLVRVAIENLQEYECFYCDILKHCYINLSWKCV